MDTYYTSFIPENGTIKLSEEEAHHCVKVLRRKIGTIVQLIDGKETKALGEIISDSDKNCIIEIKSISHHTSKPLLHIAIAPTKMMDRYEYFLEKATELGVASITPIQCKNSERTILKEDRLHKIILSAVKQSHQVYLPILNPLTKFETFIKNTTKDNKLICACEVGFLPIKEVMKIQSETLICIGPEGDFTKEEVSMAIENNFRPVSLGESILRVETAGIYVASLYRG